MRRLCVVLCVLMMPLGCATPDKVQLPSIELAKLRLGAIGLLSRELKLDIEIGNHNDFAVPFTGLAFKLEVNGRPFAEGLSNKSVTVPRLGYAHTQVTGRTRKLRLLRQLMTVGNSGKIDYRLFGTAHMGRLGRKGTMAFDRKGTLSLLPASARNRQGASARRMFAPSAQ